MSNNIELSSLLENTKADGAVVFNSKGEVLDYIKINYEGNIAAMAAVFIKMADDLTDDMKVGSVSQITCKADKGIFIVNKYSEDFIVAVYSDDITKSGFIMLTMNRLKIE